MTEPVAALRAADPVLRGVIDAVGELGDPRAGRPDDHYGALVRSIVGQQLSTRAARAIYQRLVERFGGRTPTPDEVLADDPDALRAAAGLSRAKVAYLRSLAEHVLGGSLELERLDELSDEEVIAELVAVKGLGLWTAHMFLMFHLQRPDVLPVGDLGIRRAVRDAYGLAELPGPAELDGDRRAMAAVPHARLPVPVAIARGHAAIGEPVRMGHPAPGTPGEARPDTRLDGGDFLFFRHAEGGATAAGGDHVGVVDLEAGTLEPVDEVDHGPAHVGKAGTVDQEADALVLEDGVVVTLLVKRQGVLEPRAAATAYTDPQSGRLGDGGLGGEELADLLGSLVCHGNHASGSIAMADRYARKHVGSIARRA